MSLYQSIVFIARNVVNSITRILHDHLTNSSLITQTYFITPNHSGKKHFFSSFSRFQILFRGYATLFPANNIPGERKFQANPSKSSAGWTPPRVSVSA